MIATKARIGRLPGAGEVANGIAGCVAAQGFESLDITTLHAQRAGRRPGKHGDPIDRMLIAQAQIEDLPIVANETVFDGFGVGRIW